VKVTETYVPGSSAPPCNAVSLKVLKRQVTAFEYLNSAKFLAELKSGSIPAFERLAGELFKPLWRFLVNQIHVPEADAEELAQDALMTVHSAVGTFRRDGRAKLTTWIFNIAHNRGIDFHRTAEQKSRERAEYEQPVHWNGVFAGRNADMLDELKDELAKLSSDDQQVLLWRAQGISYAQIANWLEIKEATARVRYLRAKKKLRVPEDQPELVALTVGHEMPESGGAHE